MLDLQLLPDEYAVCRMRVGAPVPTQLQPVDDEVVSMSWSAREISVICPLAMIDAVRDADEEATIEQPWRCFRVGGPLDLAMTGVLASVVVPLSEARVNLFAFSTFDTDHVLVPAVRVAEAMTALDAAGHRVTTVGT